MAATNDAYDRASLSARGRRRARGMISALIGALAGTAALLGGGPRDGAPGWPSPLEASAQPSPWQIEELGGFELMGQETNRWCWAAVNRMAKKLTSPGAPPTQCAIVHDWLVPRVSDIFLNTCCSQCASSCTLSCSSGACGPSLCARVSCSPFGTTPCPGFAAPGSGGPFGSSEVTLVNPNIHEEILKRHRPVALACTTGPGASFSGKHMMIAVGAGTYDDGSYASDIVTVADPWPVEAGAMGISFLDSGGDVFLITDQVISPTQAYACTGVIFNGQL